MLHSDSNMAICKFPDADKCVSFSGSIAVYQKASSSRRWRPLISSAFTCKLRLLHSGPKNQRVETSDLGSNKSRKMALNIEPSTVTFPAGGGIATLELISQAEGRYAFKVKSSNNKHYRVMPVYGFVEKDSRTQVMIIRLEGPPKEDKFVFEWAEVPEEEIEAQAPFRAGAQVGEVWLPVRAE